MNTNNIILFSKDVRYILALILQRYQHWQQQFYCLVDILLFLINISDSTVQLICCPWTIIKEMWQLSTIITCGCYFSCTLFRLKGAPARFSLDTVRELNFHSVKERRESIQKWAQSANPVSTTKGSDPGIFGLLFWQYRICLHSFDVLMISRLHVAWSVLDLMKGSYVKPSHNKI